MKIETTEFERSMDEGYYISSNAPASGEFVKMEDYKKLEAENEALEKEIAELAAEFHV